MVVFKCKMFCQKMSNQQVLSAQFSARSDYANMLFIAPVNVV